VSKETYCSVKRDLLQCQKRPTTVSKETYYSVKRDLYYNVKRDLLQYQKRPTTVSKETCYSVKRDLLQCQKRPTTVSKETSYSVKRDLYYSAKRDLLQCQKRPTNVYLEEPGMLRSGMKVLIAVSACIRTCECVYGEEDTCLSCEEEDTYLDRHVCLYPHLRVCIWGGGYMLVM